MKKYVSCIILIVACIACATIFYVNAKTTEANYSRRMRDYAYQYNMPEQLRITGANTRIKPGENHMRLGKATRLQENLAKRARRAS